MRSGVINDSLRSVLDEELKKLETLYKTLVPNSRKHLLIGKHLVNLPPLFRRFFREAFVDHWHDFVQ